VNEAEHQLTCQEINNLKFQQTLTLRFSTEPFLCEDQEFGGGRLGDESVAPCTTLQVGNKTATCLENRLWGNRRDNCVLVRLQELLDESLVGESPANIRAIIDILTQVSNTSGIRINVTLMEDILETVDVVIGDESRESWLILNAEFAEENRLSTRSENIQNRSVSSALLASIETISNALTDDPDFNIATQLIILNRTSFSGSFSASLNSTVELDLPGPHQNSFITTINFNSLDNVLPPNNTNNDTSLVINGNVVLVQSNSSVTNVTFTFDIDNTTLTSPLCVFWDFNALQGRGGWDTTGCTLGISVNQTVTCNCDHLTSFSILMSTSELDLDFLSYITYIGVGISMASLVTCLIIEAIIWKKIKNNRTSYFRHVCIVNIAVSLLIADIWFIVSAAISGEEIGHDACATATFFIHFFYLSMFFWMLMSALLLLYYTVRVFEGGLSEGSMLAIGFSVGYGGPLIIAVITIAVTAPSDVYVRENGVCWLNWEPSKALLAFVIPALAIVLINLVILVVVMYKILRSGNMANNSDKNTLLVIVRSLAVLTPFFGTTWGLGVGTLTSPENVGIHVAFAVFNSLQGFFILVFGTLLDRKHFGWQLFFQWTGVLPSLGQEKRSLQCELRVSNKHIWSQ
ncbi:hypothetical protein CRUP_022695, partial [Coryphaenoides rupestris]